MCMKNTYLHSNLRLIALAAHLGMCKGSCPKKILPSGNTTGCFYMHYGNWFSVREGLHFCTTAAIAGNYPYPELTPSSCSTLAEVMLLL
jgi:hypothetical protein